MVPAQSKFYGVCSLLVFWIKANWRPFQIKGGVSLRWIPPTMHMRGQNWRPWEVAHSSRIGIKLEPKVHYPIVMQCRCLIHGGRTSHAPSSHINVKNSNRYSVTGRRWTSAHGLLLFSPNCYSYHACFLIFAAIFTKNQCYHHFQREIFLQNHILSQFRKKMGYYCFHQGPFNFIGQFH